MGIEVPQTTAGVSKERGACSPLTNPSEFRNNVVSLLGDLERVIAAGSVPGKKGTLNAM